MGVSNADIVVEGPEIPAARRQRRVVRRRDRAVRHRGADRARKVFELDDAVLGSRRRPDDRRASRRRRFRVRFVADFPAPIGTQYFDGEIDATTLSHARSPARARSPTCTRSRRCGRAGSARGGSLENALVFAPDGPMQPLRWPNEPVRHKVLDLIGDFALLGAWPQCEIVAIKSGHELHAAMTARIARRDRPLPSA